MEGTRGRIVKEVVSSALLISTRSLLIHLHYSCLYGYICQFFVFGILIIFAPIISPFCYYTQFFPHKHSVKIKHCYCFKFRNIYSEEILSFKNVFVFPVYYFLNQIIFNYKKRKNPCQVHHGCQISHPNCVRLASNWTNLGLFKISFSAFWLSSQNVLKLILKIKKHFINKEMYMVHLL